MDIQLSRYRGRTSSSIARQNSTGSFHARPNSHKAQAKQRLDVQASLSLPHQQLYQFQDRPSPPSLQTTLIRESQILYISRVDAARSLRWHLRSSSSCPGPFIHLPRTIVLPSSRVQTPASLVRSKESSPVFAATRPSPRQHVCTRASHLGRTRHHSAPDLSPFALAYRWQLGLERRSHW